MMTSSECRKRERGVERVEVIGVGRSFGSTIGLYATSAVFDGGILNVITGGNGSGKSTLLRIIGRIIEPTVGFVQFVPELTVNEVRREIGWVSHETLVYPDLSAQENVVVAAERYGIDGSQAWGEACARFGFGRFADRPVRTYSRGQRQRVALARGLVHGPSVLLLDEPTAGLDREGVGRLVVVLEEEVKRGRVVVVVTHEPEIFSSLGGREVRLERGRTVK